MKYKEKGAILMPWLKRGPGSDVTLRINDANLCPGECVRMNGEFKEVCIMPGASCKGMCCVQGLLHLGMDDACSLSGPWEQIIYLLIFNLFFFLP